MLSGEGLGGQVCFWVPPFVLKTLVFLLNSAGRLGDAGLNAAVGGW